MPEEALTTHPPLAPAAVSIGHRICPNHDIDTPSWIKLSLACMVASALVLTNLAITNSYNAAVVRNGANAQLDRCEPSAGEYLDKNKQMRPVIIDWGLYNTLRLLGAGAVPMDQLSLNPVGQDLDARTRNELTRALSQPGVVLVGHTPENRFSPTSKRDHDPAEQKWSAEHCPPFQMASADRHQHLTA